VGGGIPPHFPPVIRALITDVKSVKPYSFCQLFFMTVTDKPPTTPGVSEPGVQPALSWLTITNKNHYTSLEN